MGIHCLHNAGKHQQELDIFVWRVARVKQILAVVCRDGPVVVLAGAIHARIRLLVKQASQIMLVGNPLHRLHHKLVVVNRNVCRLINRGKLMLCRRNLVVLCLCRNAQLPQFLVQILHVRADTLLDDAKVMVFHLLSLRGRCAEQRASRKHQVLPLHI